MIVDASAFLSIYLEEADAPLIARKLEAASLLLMSSVTVVELFLFISRRNGDDTQRLVEAYIADLGIQVVPFTPAQAILALRAYLQFGKGRHPAQLNYGDCMVYALAKESGFPLLFKGNDFGHTDLLFA